MTENTQHTVMVEKYITQMHLEVIKNHCLTKYIVLLTQIQCSKIHQTDVQINQRVNCFQIDTHLTWSKIITTSQMNYFQFFFLAFICCNYEVLTASFPFHFRPQGLKPMSILVGEALFNVVGPCRIFSLDVPGCNIRQKV